MATNGASGAMRRRSRQNSSMSPITSTAASRASPTVQCGAGWVSGTPGASTSAEILDQSMWRRSAVGMPAPRRLLTSPRHRRPSRRRRRRPRAARSRSPVPEPPRPNMRDLFSGEGGDGDHQRSFSVDRPAQREHDRDDPEADHDLRLGPALLLEVVMQRRHAEYALAGELERHHLHDHRNRFEHEQPADHRRARSRAWSRPRWRRACRRARASRCRP